MQRLIGWEGEVPQGLRGLLQTPHNQSLQGDRPDPGDVVDCSLQTVRPRIGPHGMCDTWVNAGIL